MNDKAIGGYFSLELPLLSEYHNNAIKLNSGKNAFEYILRSRSISKIYVPYYTCSVIFKPIKLLDIEYEFYHINDKFEISTDIKVNDDEAILYTNYYGLKDEYINKICKIYGDRLIVDNAQSFYSKPLKNVDTFYSCRKFFGVLDGGYAYVSNTPDICLRKSTSYERMTYLLKRIDTSAEDAFGDYRRDCHLGELPIQHMSSITQRIMQSINYKDIAIKRRANFNFLAECLGSSNKLDIHTTDNLNPLVYPYLVDNKGLADYLISNRVYIAKYWPNVLDYCCNDTLEFEFATCLIPLPIDQRYDKNDMDTIIRLIRKYESE